MNARAASILPAANTAAARSARWAIDGVWRAFFRALRTDQCRSVHRRRLAERNGWSSGARPIPERRRQPIVPKLAAPKHVTLHDDVSLPRITAMSRRSTSRRRSGLVGRGKPTPRFLMYAIASFAAGLIGEQNARLSGRFNVVIYAGPGRMGDRQAFADAEIAMLKAGTQVRRTPAEARPLSNRCTGRFTPQQYNVNFGDIQSAMRGCSRDFECRTWPTDTAVSDVFRLGLGLAADGWPACIKHVRPLSNKVSLYASSPAACPPASGCLEASCRSLSCGKSGGTASRR